MRDVLTVTTSTLMGDYEVEEYYGYISVNFVTGANFLVDWIASFTDFMGGISKSYTRELDILKSMARSSLETKAKLLGMNCILGLSIDLDPIFGSSYSMFMVSATGTACKLKNFKTFEETEDPTTFNIKYDLSRLYSSIQLINKPIDLYSSTLEEVESFLATLPKGSELQLVDNFLSALKTNTGKLPFAEFSENLLPITEFFYKNNYFNISKYVTENITREKALFIKTFNIINYESLLSQFKNIKDKDNELDLIVALGAKPLTVSKDDFYALKELLVLIHSKYSNLVKTKNQGIGKKKTLWICKNCDSGVDMDRESCHLCGYDKFGLPGRTSRYIGGNGQLLAFSRKLSNLENIYDVLSKYYN